MCSADVNEKLKYITKQFLCCVPIPNIQWMNVFDNLLWQYQEILINDTVNNDLVIKYPIKVTYQKSFLKFIINRLEEQGTEIHDYVYESFARLVALADPAAYYKHYIIEENITTLKENQNIISEGTTGLCSWQASLALSEWCLYNKNILSGKTVLELGSGIGLTGITVALSCKPNKIYLTDCHPAVLQSLCSNVKLNIGISVSNLNRKDNRVLLSETIISNNITVEVLNLAWESISQETCKFICPDLLLAADVIYDSSLHQPLINAISYFLKYQNTKEAFIACTERNKHTLEGFLNKLVKSGLEFKELKLPNQHHFIWSIESPIRLFSIKFPRFDDSITDPDFTYEPESNLETIYCVTDDLNMDESLPPVRHLNESIHFHQNANKGFEELEELPLGQAARENINKQTEQEFKI